MRCDQLGRVAATHSRMMVAEIYSKLTEYLENALISRQETPTIQLRLTRALHFRDDKSVESLVQNVIGGVISVARKHLHGQMFSPRITAQALALRKARHHLQGVAEHHAVRPVLVVLIELGLVDALGDAIEVGE